MIKLNSFTKKYGKDKIASDNISFTVEPNSITGLLGPNGAGKTTIIKAICSIHYPTSGDVFVYSKTGQQFNTSIDIEKSRRLIGYVSEIPHLYTNLSVIEYLQIMMNIWNLTHEEKNKNLEKVIKDFKIKDVLHQKINTLSKGFCQRVNFASALIHDPEILILDEPSSGLDPNQIIENRNLIKNYSKNKTIVLSTHIMQEAENLCDNVVIISEGKVLAKGSVEDIKKQTKAKNLEQAYINLTKNLSKTGVDNA